MLTEKEEALKKADMLIKRRPELLHQKTIMWDNCETNYEEFCGLLKANAIPTKELDFDGKCFY